jgi:hypothetical protein
VTIFTILNLRSEFDELTRDFSMVRNNSCIDTIEWFIDNGHRSNRLRNGYKRAKEIALIIKEYSDGRYKDN